jgi:hypothetical protein
VEAQILIAPPQGGCAWLRLGDVKATITGEHKTTTSIVTPCGVATKLVTFPDLGFTNESLQALSPNEIRLAFFNGYSASNSTQDYRIRIALDGRLLFSGKIEARSVYTPAVRVYQGTDQFVNYCINKNRPTYSSDLRLYCNVPSVNYGVVKIYSDHR